MSTFPVLHWCLGLAVILIGVGVLSVCLALSARLRHGKSPKWDNFDRA